MIVVLLAHKVDPAEIERLRAAHLDWLKAGLAEGRLLMAGRKLAAAGGVLLTRGTLDEVKAWAATDPFALAGASDYEFVEIAPGIVAPGLEALAG